MFGREIKISSGLIKLITMKKCSEFWKCNNIFIDNPSLRNKYFETFVKEAKLI